MQPRRSTGMPIVDAQSDFSRALRRNYLARLAGRLRREPDDIDVVLPFEEVLDALGFVGKRSLGLQVVAIASIIGSVDRTRDFDRSFRPTSGRVRQRWERIDAAMRSGKAMPPVSLIRVGEIHFVEDGHHRISVARAMGWEVIDAFVTEVQTRVGASRTTQVSDLPLKSHERVFRERVPLPAADQAELRLTDPWGYAKLAEGVEAWGFRAMQVRQEFLDRPTVAQLWLDEEYRPVVALLREAGLLGSGTETDAYMRVADERYRLLRTHEWSRDVVNRVARKLKRSPHPRPSMRRLRPDSGSNS
jgi:hypothetical protein